MSAFPFIAADVKRAAAAVDVHEDILLKAIRATNPGTYPPPLRAKRASKKFLIGAAELREWFDSLPDA